MSIIDTIAEKLSSDDKHGKISPQTQPWPGLTHKLHPLPDHGEGSYRGSGRLAGKAAIITGGDSGIGRAVAIAFAREGADVLISYLPVEQEDADETKRWVEEAGQRCVLCPGDLQDPQQCATVIEQAIAAFGRLDVLVNNAAFQMYHAEFEDITWEEWRQAYATNVDAMFMLCKAAVPYMREGASIINTTSIQATTPIPGLLGYASTKAAIVNFTEALGGLLAKRGIRVNCVAPGPVWTPISPATMPAEFMAGYGMRTPMGRPGQPAECAGAYVYLASSDAGFTTGAKITVAGGMPVLTA
ncbi:SDR family oxidoreductase [Methylobacterium sp. WL64]|uniref:SDR family oxidoreductase n=1 Tax=Methylobacterium sp. WL64 TaxID=2603894 RepID=UPI0011CB1749|nr:SDR family oxidoreductase [Methylobacterium sp. WL64]TXN00162.1 SDR family oxidoreductase [Methylobacterium sp. WL64]